MALGHQGGAASGGQHRSAHTTHAPRSVVAVVSGLALAVAGLAGGAAGSMGVANAEPSGPSAPSGSSAAAFNPLDGFDQWNVVSFGDTTINAESEGAVAVGGTLTFTGTNTAMHTAADVDGVAIGLIASKVNFAGSQGQLQVQHGGFRVGDANSTSVLTRDQNNASVNAQAVAKGGAYDSAPGIVAQNANGAVSGFEEGLFGKLFTVDQAKKASQRVLAAADCNIPATVTGEAPNVTVSLTSGGANYWTIDAESFSKLKEIKFEGTTPSPENPLIVNITGNGTVTFGNTLAGTRAPERILWNIPEATLVQQQGGDIDGSVLAPNAHYSKTASNVQGNVIVASADHKGSEEHFHPFQGLVKDCDKPVAKVGGFSLSKTLSGVEGSVFPGGTTFGVTASWTVDGVQKSQTFDLPVDGSVVEGPQDLPVETVVSFSEAKAPEVEGYSFTGVSFSPESVTVADGVDAKVVATNTYEKQVAKAGAFSITKKVSGVKEVDRSFTFAYSTSTGDKGEVALRNGQTWSSESYPVGTVVTVEETGSTSLPGHTFTGVSFSGQGMGVSEDGKPATLTISDSTAVALTATNTYEVPKVPGKPGVPGKELAHTGFSAPVLLGGAGALVAGASLLTLSALRRRRD